jgi:hypothetical protein
MRKSISNTEILFITHSSSDDKGRRVVVREGIVENTLYPGEEDDKATQRLLGLDSEGLVMIKAFFQSERRLF